MVVGIGIIEIFIVESRSLKEKRSVLRRITSRTQNKFSLSVAEVGDNDEWKRGKLGFAFVGNDRGFVNSKLDKIVQFIEGLNVANVINSRIELINVSDTTYDFGDAEGICDGF
ncbi:MAG: DUF503 domain-containing protein [Deltaproteobacteria bacterium]|nr:DUF503 domain-containing protein [Deltaproteobacteria bacterium]